MTSQKLEDSLSLSPDSQRKAFESRDHFDLVVVYDANTTSWPKKGSAPTPLSRLWDIIYEHEFAKKLERTPVMLTGGYRAWAEFQKYRQARHNQAASAVNGGSGGMGQPNGHGRPNGYGPSSSKGAGAYGSNGVLKGFDKVPS